MHIVIGLAVMPGPRKTASGIRTDAVREMIADDLLTRIMGSPDNEAVILRPSLIGPAHSPSRGKWGIDEPHPHPDIPAG